MELDEARVGRASACAAAPRRIIVLSIVLADLTGVGICQSRSNRCICFQIIDNRRAGCRRPAWPRNQVEITLVFTLGVERECNKEGEQCVVCSMNRLCYYPALVVLADLSTLFQLRPVA